MCVCINVCVRVRVCVCVCVRVCVCRQAHARVSIYSCLYMYLSKYLLKVSDSHSEWLLFLPQHLNWIKKKKKPVLCFNAMT